VNDGDLWKFYVLRRSRIERKFVQVMKMPIYLPLSVGVINRRAMRGSSHIEGLAYLSHETRASVVFEDPIDVTDIVLLNPYNYYALF